VRRTWGLLSSPFWAGLLDQELDTGVVEGSPTFSKIGEKWFSFLLDIVGWKRTGKGGR
jgi:hypothetical protein